MANILKCQNLTIGTGKRDIVKNLSFYAGRGEFIGIIGESGSGKTLTALALSNLLPSGVKVKDGSIKRYGSLISSVFQNSMSGLNPLIKIGIQISEAITGNGPLKSKDHKKRVIETLELVGMPRPEEIYKSYPHELSGGMRQRAAIAMAIIKKPDIIILDEPTTALDVTVQALILSLLEDIRRNTGITIIMISHDLTLVKENADRIYLMYGGKTMEENNALSLFEKPLHPYTEGLIKSVDSVVSKDKPFFMLEGNYKEYKTGCIFRNRCRYRMEICELEEPLYLESGTGKVRCHLYGSSFKKERP